MSAWDPGPIPRGCGQADPRLPRPPSLSLPVGRKTAARGKGLRSCPRPRGASCGGRSGEPSRGGGRGQAGERRVMAARPSDWVMGLRAEALAVCPEAALAHPCPDHRAREAIPSPPSGDAGPAGSRGGGRARQTWLGSGARRKWRWRKALLLCTLSTPHAPFLRPAVARGFRELPGRDPHGATRRLALESLALWDVFSIPQPRAPTGRSINYGHPF